MPISVECPSCRATFRVKDEAAGKRGRCPACKETLTVPTPPAAPEASADLDVGLVPLPADEVRRGKPLGAALTAAPQVEAEDGDGYQLDGGAARKKVKSQGVRTRTRTPGVGVSADGVRQAAAATRIERTPAEILAAFQDEIEPFRPSPLYSLWMLIVAGFMVLLPLVYVALVGLVVWAVGYHAVNHLTLFQHMRGSSGFKFAVILYVTPLIGGVVMVAFMLKPLFARAAKPENLRELDPEVEPLLFAFIDGVCTTVGAPRPERIQVDCNVNAAAGYSGGAFSISAREPVLTIGLGMVAGLDLKQFAGVMAHELGHIAQGSGARLMEIISSINVWFARVVYERDEWDETLYRWEHGDNNALVTVGYVGRFAVWLTRRMLWVLLHVGHLVNMVFLRQREFDADRYEARMTGGETFAQTMWRVNELQLASRGAMADLQSSWQQRRLPDDFPKLILANVPQIPKEALDAYRKAAAEAKTGLFDTHPSDRDRIARARREEPGAGIFDLRGPATDVFRNFDSLARAVTFDYYKSMLGRDITKDQLFPVADLVESQVVDQTGYVAADRFFLEALPTIQPFRLPHDYPKMPPHAKNAKQTLIKTRDAQQAAREAALAACGRFAGIEERLVKADAAWTMLRTDVKLDAGRWGLPKATLDAAEWARDGARSELETLIASLEPYAATAASRLTQALAILEVDVVAERVTDGCDRREEARTLYPCVAHLGANVLATLLPVMHARRSLGLLLERFNEGNNQTNQPLINAVLRGSQALRDKLEELRWRVGDMHDYPFEHAKDDMTLGRFAFPPIMPEKNDVGGLLDTADAAFDRLLGLYRRALGRLTVTAEEVELALGLAPIDPPSADR